MRHRQRLSFVSTLHLSPGFVVNMMNNGLRYVTDVVACPRDSFCKIEIFQSGKRFIEMKLSPKLSFDRSVRVVHKRNVLSEPIRGSIVLLKNHSLAELSRPIPYLPATDVLATSSAELFNECTDPTCVDRKTVGTHEHQ